ncbi:MAG TPA: hypothetical protein VNO30_02950 [Kofleriaceae bacterium]|nr:hypothetical protein [Kofleriaceae bacterium]
MRLPRHVALGLVAAAGCNQIWGLDQVDLADQPDKKTRIRLQLQIARTTDEGYADPTLEYRVLQPPPVIQLGLVGEPLAEDVYRPDDGGTISYSTTFVGQRWRLAYTLAGGVPREVQWSPPAEDQLPLLVEPLVGRAERLPVPAGSGYAITPLGSPLSHTQPRVFTTGLWTESAFSGTSPGATFNYDFGANAVSQSGLLGAPEPARGDHGVLADYKNLNGCRVTSGVAVFGVPDLVAGQLTAPSPQPTYFSADKQVRLTFAGSPVGARLQALLGDRAAPADLLRMEYGYAPSLGISGFTRPAPTPVLDFFLPGPPMIAFANCTFAPMQLFQTESFADSPELTERFFRVVHVEAANQRVRGALTLTSGFAAVVTSSDYNFFTDFTVAAPRKVVLSRAGSQLADLDDLTQEAEPLALGAEPLELSFGIESGSTLVTDSFDVTLYSIAGSALTAERIYTSTERKLSIDPSLLRPGTEYVFELRAYRGRPSAARADFSIHTYPQYVASIFTRTFKTAP